VPTSIEAALNSTTDEAFKVSDYSSVLIPKGADTDVVRSSLRSTVRRLPAGTPSFVVGAVRQICHCSYLCCDMSIGLLETSVQVVSGWHQAGSTITLQLTAVKTQHIRTIFTVKCIAHSQVWVEDWPAGPSSPEADADNPNHVLHAGQLLAEDPRLVLGIPVELEWLTDNPGQQGRLTGSFHPLDGADWTNQAYARWVRRGKRMSMCDFLGGRFGGRGAYQRACLIHALQGGDRTGKL
jgi:hypothetical protein